MAKVCTKCKIEKDEGEFGRNKNYPAGRVPECKACTKIARRAWSNSIIGLASRAAARERFLAKVAKIRDEHQASGYLHKCSICDTMKSISEFCTNDLNRCKTCHAAKQAARRKTPEGMACIQRQRESAAHREAIAQTMKSCTCCGEQKPQSDFGLHWAGRDGRYSWCRGCHNARVKAWGRTEVGKQKRLEYNQRNRMKGYLRNRLNSAIRAQGNSVKDRGGSAVRDLGCSIPFLKDYLAARFKPGMTWDNWGAGHGKWQIDHILPVTSFPDLTDRDQFLQCCHYTNLQPLWFIENMRKFNKVPHELAA